jgi:hypothetical protein
MSPALGSTRPGLTNLWYAYPKWRVERFPWQAALTAVPNFYLFCSNRLSILWIICVYRYISDCVETVHELHFLPNNIAIEIFLHKSGLDIYHWGAGLVVARRISDIGQKCLQSSFQTGCSSSDSYFHIFFLIAFLDQAFARNIIIILCINYIIIICINNNFESFQDLILLLKIAKGTRRYFL